MRTVEILRQRVQAASAHTHFNAAAALDDAVLTAPKPMRCTKCNGEMLTISFRGVEIDRCADCGGLWFDVLEHEQLRKLESSERVDSGDRLVGQRFNHLSGVFRCPRCDTPMTRVTDAHHPQIHFEKCPRDYGVFFDAGEFHDFKGHTLQARLHALFGG